MYRIYMVMVGPEKIRRIYGFSAYMVYFGGTKPCPIYTERSLYENQCDLKLTK